MKARPIATSDAPTVEEAILRIVSVRFAEVLVLSQALQHRRAAELHDFRIACKRARYMCERFTPQHPELRDAATRLTELQDALGEAHDRDVLLEEIQSDAPRTARRLQQERTRCVTRASALWHDAFARNGPFQAVVALMRRG